jgi:hypothetical protein
MYSSDSSLLEMDEEMVNDSPKSVPPPARWKPIMFDLNKAPPTTTKDEAAKPAVMGTERQRDRSPVVRTQMPKGRRMKSITTFPVVGPPSGGSNRRIGFGFSSQNQRGPMVMPRHTQPASLAEALEEMRSSDTWATVQEHAQPIHQEQARVHDGGFSFTRDFEHQLGRIYHGVVALPPSPDSERSQSPPSPIWPHSGEGMCQPTTLPKVVMGDNLPHNRQGERRDNGPMKLPCDGMKPVLMESAETSLLGWFEATQLPVTEEIVYPSVFSDHTDSDLFNIYDSVFLFPPRTHFDGRPLGYHVIQPFVEEVCNAGIAVGNTVGELQSMFGHSGVFLEYTNRKKAYIKGLVRHLRKILPSVTKLFVDLAHILQIVALEPQLATSLRSTRAVLLGNEVVDQMAGVHNTRYELMLASGHGVIDEMVHSLRLAVSSFLEARGMVEQFRLQREAPFASTVQQALGNTSSGSGGTREAAMSMLRQDPSWRAFHKKVRHMVLHAKIAQQWGRDFLRQAVHKRVEYSMRIMPGLSSMVEVLASHSEPVWGQVDKCKTYKPRSAALRASKGKFEED